MPSSEALRNYQAYQAQLEAELEAEHFGRFALLHNCEVVDIYDDKASAYAAGCAQYGLGRFSFQEIGARPIRLGIMPASDR